MVRRLIMALLIGMGLYVSVAVIDTAVNADQHKVLACAGGQTDPCVHSVGHARR